MIGRITPRKLNVDTDERSLSSDEMKNALNLAVSADAEGDGGVVKFSDGNLSISSSDPLSGMNAGENTVVGSVTDEELGVVYFFVHNDQGNHGIYAYSEKTNTYRKIFSDTSLDFDKDGFVKGDVVRVKRNPEIVAPDVVVGQGDEGGVVDIFPEDFNIIEAFNNEDGIPEDFVMPMTDFTVQLITRIDDVQYLDEDVLDFESFFNKYGDPSLYELSLEASVTGRVKILDEASFVSTTSPSNTPPFESGNGTLVEDAPFKIYENGVDFMSQDHTPSVFVGENQEHSLRVYEGSVYLISKVDFSYPKFFYFSGTIEGASPNPTDPDLVVDDEGTPFTQWTYDQSIAWTFYPNTRIKLMCELKYNNDVSFSPHRTAIDGESVSIETLRRIQLLEKTNSTFGYYRTDSEYNPFALDNEGVTDYFSVPTTWSREFGYSERFPDDEWFESNQTSFDVYSQFAPLTAVLPTVGSTALYSLVSSSLGSLDLDSTPSRYNEQHRILAAKRVVPGTDQTITFSSGEIDFKKISAIVRVKVDLSNSPTYQNALEVGEIISNGSTSPENWPTDVPDAVFRSATDELPISIFIQTRCPSEGSFRLFGSNVEVSRYNVDGSPKSWDQVFAEGVASLVTSNPSFYGVETGGIANSDINNSSNYYNDLGLMIAAAEQALDLPYYNGSEYNFVILNIPGSPSTVVPGLDPCPAVSLGEVFRPTLYYFGVDGDESKYQEYLPLNRAPSGATIQEAIADLQNPVYEFILNIPISMPLQDENGDGILHLRNKSSIPDWDFQEVVSQEDYDISVYTYDGEDYISEDLKSELSSLSNDLTINYSFNGGPTQVHNISGRRIRIPYRTALDSGVDKLSAQLPESLLNFAVENGSSWYNSAETMSHLSPSSSPEDPFCFGSSTSCSESLRVLPDVVQTSDTSVTDPIDPVVTISDEDSTTGPIRVTETEPERPVEQSRLTPKPLVTKTKKTIKKKY